MLSQRDPRWAHKRIGRTNLTLGTHGCTLTCIAQVLGTSPDKVADRLYQVSALQGALVIWTRLQIAYPELKFVWRGYSWNEVVVETAIETHGFCLVEVDFDSNSRTPDRHWVLLTPQGSLDPWVGGIKNYPVKTGYSILHLNKPVIENPIIEEVFDMADQAGNILKRMELGARLVEKDGGFYLRFKEFDYWIPSASVMVALGYGRDESSIQWNKAMKVNKIKEAW